MARTLDLNKIIRLEKLLCHFDKSLGRYAFRACFYFQEAIPPSEFYTFYGTKLYQTQLYNYFLRGMANRSLVAKLQEQKIDNVMAAVSFGNSYLQSIEMSEVTRNFCRANGGQEISLTREARLGHSDKKSKSDKVNHLAFDPEADEFRTGSGSDNEDVKAIQPTTFSSKATNGSSLGRHGRKWGRRRRSWRP